MQEISNTPATWNLNKDTFCHADRIELSSGEGLSSYEGRSPGYSEAPVQAREFNLFAGNRTADCPSVYGGGSILVIGQPLLTCVCFPRSTCARREAEISSFKRPCRSPEEGQLDEEGYPDVERFAR